MVCGCFFNENMVKYGKGGDKDFTSPDKNGYPTAVRLSLACARSRSGWWETAPKACKKKTFQKPEKPLLY
jgi:hypothetical protein